MAYNHALTYSDMSRVSTLDSDENAQLRLSIWQDFTVAQPLAIHDDQSGLRVVDGSAADESTMQEQVYSWPIPQETFAGIDEEEVRQEIRAALQDPLDVSRPPSERGIEVLCAFIAKAEQVIAGGAAMPVPSEQPSSQSSSQDALAPNPLLALVLHLRWLLRCFEGRPGTSVSIR